ncbi:hypothetical protein ASPCADRAFT_204130 [Aspergillus carbonarius ITEM 5010]|uniref:GCN5-related N-acetyltransferase Rv2170-like domain-containing protein n=1 Tax=Aspergillus carbonarius (strain ITEM 5010) TaxID=602072 RepID=A0A1R3S0K0_ASPC5|nr:hypothetical protein ASPCADRAFT_204130 [Aspergillus carbonarius ITEM 5010]
MHPIYETSPRSPRTQTELLPLLKSHLPHSLPLLRRIQHEIAHPSPTAVILTTFPGPVSASAPAPAPAAASSSASPASPSGVETRPALVPIPEPSPAPRPGSGPRVPDHDVVPWLIAYVDLSAGRETQIVLYSNLERASFPSVTTTNKCPGNSPPIAIPISTLPQFTSSSTSTSTSKDLLLSLLKYTKSTLLPAYLSTIPPPAPPTPDHQLAPPPPTAFLIGNLHTGIFSSLLNPGTSYPDADLETGFVADVKVHRFDRAPYVKYIFSPAIISADSSINGAMKGFHFGDGNVKRSDLGIVRARTVIPRSEETLAKLTSCAVYRDSGFVTSPDGGEERQPVAWAFLGTDGSLATLHVEEEVRGLGLAGLVGREVMRRGLKDEGEDGNEGWVHANVAMENRASRRVMEKLGGEVGWTVTWTVLEV